MIVYSFVVSYLMLVFKLKRGPLHIGFGVKTSALSQRLMLENLVTALLPLTAASNVTAGVINFLAPRDLVSTKTF